jgi:hypothetical protein
MLIGLVGLIGAGKGTVGDFLIRDHGFAADSFAATLKDCLSLMFGWPRPLLEGDTVESRLWREQVDPWWSGRLGIPAFSPRMAMQLVGTDALRDHFHPQMWVMTVERRLLQTLGTPTVLTDARFPDELTLLRRYGGILVQVRRGPDPVWHNIALAANGGDREALAIMRTTYKDIHRSEWAWLGQPVDRVLTNDGTLADLAAQVSDLVRGQAANANTVPRVRAS